jgi:hypothetical protein
MAILGTNPYTKAIPLVGGGYSVSTAPKGTSNAIKHTTVNVPKTSTYYKAPTKPKITATVSAKTVSAPIASASANYQTVQAPQAAPVPVAPPAPTLDDLINKYYAASQGDINSLYDKQNTQQLAALKAQQDTATANTKQDYYNKKNQADVVNAQNVQKLRELMASQGIAASGDNLTLNAKANSDRLNSLNTLNTQEQATLNDINNPSKAQAIQNQIETARAQALLNAKQNAYSRAWNEYGFGNMSAAQQAQLAMSKYNLDSTNAANTASNQAALDYYNSMGFNSAGGGGGKLSGSSNAEKIWNFLKGKGLSTGAIAGIMGNLQQESSLNPGVNADGLAQWGGSRRTAMQNYARSAGLPSNSLEAQLGYLWQELNSGSGGLSVAQINGLSPSQAAILFSNKFERPASWAANNNGRANYANQFYNLYANSKGV